MAQYLLHPKHPLRTALYVILAVGLVVGGFVTFKASQTSTEGRSKAAQEGKTYARWEFNGVTPEGWEHLGLQSLAVSKGKLRGVMSDPPQTSYVFKNNINAKMDRGNKKLSLRMAVGSVQVLPPVDGQTPTYIFLDETEGNDLSEVDCVVASSGLTVCSTGGIGVVTQPGQSGSGIGSDTVVIDDYVIATPAPIDPIKCIVRPTCAPGSDCPLPLLEPRNGWCPEGTPTPTCVPKPNPICTTPDVNGVSSCIDETIGGWCPPGTPVPPPPPCQVRPACLDAQPACKKPTPRGGWCPANEFVFDVMYAYEEEPVGGDQGMGPVGPVRAEKTMQLKGLANGKFYKYNLALPEIGAIKVVDLKITFASGVNPGAQVAFDWIRLNRPKVGGRIVPTFTPTNGIGVCGTPCARKRDCASGLKCIVPRSSGQGNRSKVCAGRARNNSRGYSCPGSQN